MPESFMEYGTSFVKHCGGLPLALQVLASSLFGKSMDVWRNALEKLEAIPASKIQKILKISYDSLEDGHDKKLFLDIVCLFIGKDRYYTATILDGCDFYTTVGIENLVGRSLLTINEKNKLMMHQMIRDMGREIIRQESSDVGKRSRLWHKDAFDVIREKTGSKTIKCLTLDLKGLQEDKPKGSTTSLHFPKHSRNQFLQSNEVDMETQAFAKMQRLKLLQLDYVKLRGDFKDFPKSLVWLRWHGFHIQSLPVDFCIKRLVVLDMRNNNLKQVWKDKECLPNLKILNLNHSHNLLKTPDFCGLPSLERLMLKDCIKLEKVDPSIGELKMLTFLNLKDCRSLRKLPRTIGSLISLEELILSGCSRLDKIPRELHNMESLKVLNLDETALHQTRLPLPWLSSKRSRELGFSWKSLPCSLVKLSLESCRLSDDVMPNDLHNLASLKSLNLSRNPIHCLPDIKSLTKLDELLLTSCTELQTIPKLPMLSNSIKVLATTSPLKHSWSVLPCFFSSKRCVIFGCERLTEVQDIFKLEPTENFELEELKRLFNVDSIDNNRVQLYNYITDRKMFDTPQVLQECGITSTFVAGSEVPVGFKHQTKEHQISFCLPTPSHPDEKIRWFSLCIVFSSDGDQICDFLPSARMFNETKKIMWNHRSSFIGIPETNDGTMLWLIHWPAMDFQLEGGDVVLYDYGIITTSDPIPFDYYGQYYGHQVGKSEVSISVSPNSSRMISCLLNSIFILSSNNDKEFEFLPCLEIMNETKGTKWTYSKHFVGIPETKNNLYWMISWNFRGGELEAGDRVRLRVVSDLSVVEFGVEIVYDYEVDNRANCLHQLPRRSKYFSYLFGAFVYLSSRSQRTLYRMQSLVKC
ncbi:hypothetical protein V6N12_045865 [Hibiscus sabdariffa]|uniref:Disease resistance protein Roq1-like winged-helix domain-containing protein n=1 Tax=Hibiscus sabdariffa TaxID=183260 RepID=A0ABR2G3Y1_9ROSI